MKVPRPPRLSQKLLALVLPSSLRGEAVLGDMEEEYGRLVESEGAFRARWWYRRQAWRIIGVYALPGERPADPLTLLSPSEAAHRSSALESWRQDVRHAVRILSRSPGVSALVVLALGLGIGANTAIFSAIDAVLLRPLPFVHPDRVVQIMERRASLPDRAEVQLPLPNFADYENATSFSHVAAIRPDRVYVHEGDRRPERQIVHFSSALLDVMGVRPALGRAFLPEEDRPDPEPVVVLSYAYWQNEMGGDSTVVGRPLTITHFVPGEGYRPLTLEIVGVMPEGFRLPALEIGDDYKVWADGELFLPMGLWWWGRGNRGMYALRAVAELAPGASLSRAKAEISAIARGITRNDPDRSEGLSARVIPLKEIRRAHHGTVLGVLWAASALILLVVCANVAALLLGRALARERELAVRTSLGASRGRLLRQLLVESAVLGGTGAVAGLAVAHWGTILLKRVTPGDVHGLADAGLHLEVLLFAAGVSLLTILLFGIGPAVRGTKTHRANVLRSGGRRGVAGGLRPMRWLVAGQVALSLALLVGSGLLVRSLAGLLDVDPGFDTEETIRFVLTPPPPFRKPMENEDRVAFYQAVRDRLEGVPGVRSVGAGRIALLSGGMSDGADVTPADGLPPGRRVEVDWIGILPGFLDALGTKIVRGRPFSEADVRRELQGNRMSNPWEGIPALINQSMAARFWPDADPLGKRFYWGIQDPELVEATLGSWKPGEPYPEGWDNRYPAPLPLQVVGVVRDMRSVDLTEAAPPTFYTLNAFAAFTIYVRVAGDPFAMLPGLRGAIDAVDPDIGVESAQPMSMAVTHATADTRFQAILLSLFAGLAVVMTGLGLFGVLAYAVNRRAREMAVRMSLGARRAEVSRMVVLDGLKLAVPGILAGGALAVAGLRLTSSLLYGVSPTDPLTLAAASALILGVSLGATWLPALRALRVEPMEILREE